MPTFFLPRLAWRNIWRNRRRTWITLVSFAFGMMLAILFIGLGDNTYSSMIELAASSGSGHVSIEDPEYQELPSLKKSITIDPAWHEVVHELPQVERAVARIDGMAMLAAGAHSAGAGFIAIDPKAEDAQTLSILDAIKEGQLFAPDDAEGVVLGATLAENLDLRLGKKVVYSMTDKQGEFVSGLGRVRGIIKTGSDTVDASLALLPATAVQTLIGYQSNEFSKVALFSKDHRESKSLQQSTASLLPENLAARSWEETQPDLAGFIAIDRGSNLVFQTIIMMMIAAGIFNSLFVSVLERRREFGIMLALGYSPLQVFGLVMWESLCLASMGIVLAAAVTAWPYYYLSTTGLDMSSMMGEGGYEVAGVGLDPIVYTRIYPESLAAIIAVSITMTLIAGIYPAWRAGRVEAIESIRLV